MKKLSLAIIAFALLCGIGCGNGNGSNTDTPTPDPTPSGATSPYDDVTPEMRVETRDGLLNCDGCFETGFTEFVVLTATDNNQESYTIQADDLFSLTATREHNTIEFEKDEFSCVGEINFWRCQDGVDNLNIVSTDFVTCDPYGASVKIAVECDDETETIAFNWSSDAIMECPDGIDNSVIESCIPYDCIESYETESGGMDTRLCDELW